MGCSWRCKMCIRDRGMPFIFKGGTCLMLLMNRPRRLSTDIDIIVEPGTDLDAFIEEASKIFPFQSAEEQKRIGKNNIEKRHFKFTYDSPVNHKPLYILLDVLFEENHYAELISKEIRNELLQTQPEYLAVQIPSADCILADKLTAFAPHTTGKMCIRDRHYSPDRGRLNEPALGSAQQDSHLPRISRAAPIACICEMCIRDRASPVRFREHPVGLVFAGWYDPPQTAGCVPFGALAVSYTHLDVYKRQGLQG